jgi:eukaryotic-like serine/threonine-protein kinase
MYKPGDEIDGKFRVGGICSEMGGMGVILHVTPLRKMLPYSVALKYCRESDDEQVRRFRREVRLMASFQGNSRVAQLIDHNTEHDPPYYVMQFYPDGDVSTLAATLRSSIENQEQFFLQMIDCIQELHSRNEYHRDIKPSNFLLNGGQIVVSDFGLTTEVGSNTAFTRSSVFWGTHGFIPPEFLDGGFKYADATGDIFMLGKTFYHLLTGRDALYLQPEGIPAPIFHVIQRCCNPTKDRRYQSLAELKQSLVAAYDVLLHRLGGLGKVKQLLTSITEALDFGTYRQEDIFEFVEQLSLLDEQEQVQVCRELPPGFFAVIGQAQSAVALSTFLDVYEKLVEGRDYGWSYAETITDRMAQIVGSDGAPLSEKARALHLAIRAAHHMNRFAAMDTCRALIAGIRNEQLGFQVAPILLELRDTFISGIEPSECQNNSVAEAIRHIRQEQPGQ